MQPIIVIPARHGSSRFPGKPLKRLRGETILSWVVHRALSCPGAQVWVATDHPDIAREAERAGAEAVMTRDDHRSGSDRIAEAIRIVDPSGGAARVVVNIQGDEPLIEPDSISTLLRLFEDPRVEMATVAAPLSAPEANSADVVKVVVDGGDRALYFSRSVIPWSPSPQACLRHIGLYAYRRGLLQRLAAWPSCELERRERLEQLRALHAGVDIHVARVACAWGGVDTPEDLERLERQLADRANKGKTQ